MKGPTMEAFLTDKVVPDVIAFKPNELTEVKWGNVEATCGNTLTPTQMKEQPTVTWDADPNAFYTLIMTDPDAPSREDPKFGEWNHWLVVNIPGNRLSEGEVKSEYIGAGPPEGTGLHRYVFLVMQQLRKFSFADVPSLKNNSAKGRNNFNTRAFIQKHTLRITSGNFVQAQWDDYVPTLYKQFTE